MTERSSPTPRAVGEDAALEADEGASVEAGRRLAWRPRWSVAEPRRSPWWNVPPHGHLAVESLNRWSAAAVLAIMASGQGVLACVAVLDAGLGLGALGLIPLAVAVGSVLAAQFAARGIYRLGATTEGADNPPQRRQLDLSVAGGALACAVTLATAIGHLGTSGPSALGWLLLGLVTAASYTATPDGLGTTSVSPWQSVITRLYRLQEHRRSHPERCAARAREAITRAAVRQLCEDPAVVVPQLCAAEEAACRRGATPVAPDAKQEVTSVAGEQSDWAKQVARGAMAAKRVLVRRRMLDITHGLRVSRPTARPPAHPNGTPAGPGGNGAEAVLTAGDHLFLTGGHDHNRGTLARVDKGG
jgi:hypothetical protein